MENIKLVIWDLDDTLWRGTLSEGAVEERPEMARLVKTLALRGIVSSVCSKNDFAPAKERLEAMGLWDYFLFPSIDWTSKGGRIRDIITSMGLRPCNVLFVDDNKSNLEEARFLLPDLQTAMPEDLPALQEHSALVGRPDPSMTRLAQYRLLEAKSNDRSNYSSNDEFLRQSDIRVELLPETQPHLDRIHEMIHRNNQLNFTKDRISEEEVRHLFTDPHVESACIRVRDRYGDHGIVGCYAMKDRRLLQFVLSCRVLGMGVEQWVYAKLGYPQITVHGPVAAELAPSGLPGWINQARPAAAARQTPATEKRLLLYGSCPLRPVWAYLQPRIPNARFSEIDPEPSVCNLAVLACEGEDLRRQWLSEVSTFDSEYSFDPEVFSPQTDYVLISLDSEMKFFRYSADGHSFFSVQLSEASASAGLLSRYAERPVTYEDIARSLDCICRHLAQNTTLLIQLIPEVEFPGKGRDQNYRDRKKLNEIALRLSEVHRNVRLIDIRKYAKTTTDFYNTSSSHYNRSIGYELAQEVLRCMGIQGDVPQQTEQAPPANAVHDAFDLDGVPLRCSSWIRNGVFHIQLEDFEGTGWHVTYEFLRGRLIEYRSDPVLNASMELRIDRPGCWRVRLQVSGIEDAWFETTGIDYDDLHYGLFLDPAAEHYHSCVSALGDFVANNAKYRKNTDEMIRQIAELQAVGASVASYFLDRGIRRLDLFADARIVNVLLPFLRAAGLKLGRIYTVDSYQAFTCEGGTAIYPADDVNHGAAPSNGAHLLLAFDGRMKARWSSMFRSCGAELHDLSYVLSILKTEQFLCRKARERKLPRLICLRGPKLHPFHSFPSTSIRPTERNAYRRMGTADQALRMVQAGELLPETFSGRSTEELLETLRIPELRTDPESKITCMRDASGRYCNIEGGNRRTVGQPTPARRRVFLFGTSYAYGLGVRDEETIPSLLQRMLGPEWQVWNYANALRDTDYDTVLRRLFFTQYKPDDILVLLLTNWQAETAELRWHWLNWDACRDGVEQLDAFPAFLREDRPAYFLMDGAYTKAGNEVLAKLIFDAIGGQP